MCELNSNRIKKVFKNLLNFKVYVVLDNCLNMKRKLPNYLSKQVSSTCTLLCVSFQTVLNMKVELCEVAEVQEAFTVRKWWAIGWSARPVLSLQFVGPPCWLMSSRVLEWRPFFNVVCFQCQQLSLGCKYNSNVPKCQTKTY